MIQPPPSQTIPISHCLPSEGNHLAVDEAGGLAICNPGHGCIWLLDARGVPKFRIDTCAGHAITNLAYDPADLQRLVFTDSDTGQVLEARTPVNGHLLASHR
jgi:gluconolactonase